MIAKDRSPGLGVTFFYMDIRPMAMGGIGASGTGVYHGEWGFKTLSKLKPVLYRSPFNRLDDLYPPYGAKIARLEKLLRLMS